MSLEIPVVNLRVAIVLSELRPGGMEKVVLHLAEGLAKRDISVLIICLQSPGFFAKELINTNVRLFALESHSGKDLFALWQLRKVLKKFRPDVINLHDYASLPYAAMANLLALRCLLVFTAHGLLYGGFEKLQRRHRFFARFITAFSAVSDKVANRHRDYLDWQKQLQIIANGVPSVAVDVVKRQKVRSELGCSDETHLFLAVGNPRPEKGFEDLIEAVVCLRNQPVLEPDFLVVVAGTLTSSDYCQMLQRRIEELNVQVRCKFLGFRQDTAALYSAADSFVLSSRSEGLPLVILEAMTAGLPVIATRVGGIPDAVGEVALLVDAKQPEQLAEAMARMINDKPFRDSLAKKGKDHVERNFGVQRMVDDYLEWYRKVLSAEC
jgi:glycosyltransferase involved in cell wall biosynthesis